MQTNCLHFQSVCGTKNSSQQTSLQCVSTIYMVFSDEDKIFIITHKYAQRTVTCVEELKSMHLKCNLFAFSFISGEHLQKI